MFIGHCTTEHEENVVEIVNLFRLKRIGKWFKFVTQKLFIFSQKLLLVDF